MEFACKFCKTRRLKTVNPIPSEIKVIYRCGSELHIVITGPSTSYQWRKKCKGGA